MLIPVTCPISNIDPALLDAAVLGEDDIIRIEDTCGRAQRHGGYASLLDGAGPSPPLNLISFTERYCNQPMTFASDRLSKIDRLQYRAVQPTDEAVRQVRNPPPRSMHCARRKSANPNRVILSPPATSKATPPRNARGTDCNLPSQREVISPLLATWGDVLLLSLSLLRPGQQTRGAVTRSIPALGRTVAQR